MYNKNEEGRDPEYEAQRGVRRAERAKAEQTYREEQAKQKAAGVPQWIDQYSALLKDKGWQEMQKNYGGQMDRPWNSDEGAQRVKGELDAKYKAAVDAYNKDKGTSYAYDTRVLGANAQPNDYNHKRNSNSGFISDTISHVGEVVSKSPLAQTVISMAAAAYGIPPNVTMAMLSANNIGQGQDPAAVAKGIAMSYIGGKVGDFAGGAAGDALKNSGLGDNVTGALTNVASGAAKQLATTGKVNAQGLLTNAAGNVVTGSDTYKDLSSGVSTAFKDAGLDSINIGGVDIPGSIDLKGNLIPGVSAADATKLLSQSGSAGRKIVGVANVLRKPTLTGIASLTQPVAGTTVRRPPAAVLSASKAPVTTAAKQPPAAVLTAMNKPPTGG